MLSERMRTWAKDSWDPNGGMSANELAESDNQSVLIFAEEVAALEAELDAARRDMKITCIHCAREMLLTDEGRKQMLLKDLEATNAK